MLHVIELKFISECAPTKEAFYIRKVRVIKISSILCEWVLSHQRVRLLNMFAYLQETCVIQISRILCDRGMSH